MIKIIWGLRDEIGRPLLSVACELVMHLYLKYSHETAPSISYHVWVVKTRDHMRHLNNKSFYLLRAL